MRKRYIFPTITAETIELTTMISVSDGDVNTGGRYEDEEDDYEYIEGESETGWNIGWPD